MAALPSGTVTFLFTDVEGSTAQWESDPELMRESVERHDRIVREVVSGFGGHVFSTGGDAFCVAFARAGEAVAAAAAVQRAVGAEAWPLSSPIRVRIGVHTGEAQERDGNFFGIALNRAARIMSAGHGGQVLLSETTVAVLEQVPGDLELVDVGRHRLRDINDPIGLWALVGEGLVVDARPLAVDDEVPGNLPTLLTSLVGRHREIAAVAELLEGHRLVTIVGPGGIGKTRVAIHTAANVAWRFPDGVWFVDLLAVGGEAVEPAVAAALGVQSSDGPVDGAVLAEALRGQRLLIVMDNCEHVLPEIAALLGRLLSTAVGLVVMATSREPVGVAGEQLYPLGSLDAAVELFVDRARLGVPGLSPDEAGRVQIARLCERLDDLPLAIELAASRMRTHSLDDLLAGVEDRFALLRGSRRGGAGRHASLAATLDWSYGLLGADEQLVFDRCSVFAGAFSREDAAAVCGDDRLGPAAIEEIVDALVDKSLVRPLGGPGGAGRFDLLDTMRAYGRARLIERGVDDALTERHARWFAELAFGAGTNLHAPVVADRVAILRGAFDDCRVAFQHLQHRDIAAAERLCAGHVFSSWLLVTEPLEWALSLWDPQRQGDTSDAHLWFCATVAWGAMTFDRPELIDEVRDHLARLGADATHPATIHARCAGTALAWYRQSGHRNGDLAADALVLLDLARSSAPGTVAIAASAVTPPLDPPSARAVLDEAVREAEDLDMQMALSMLLLMRASYFRSAEDPLAANDLQLAIDIGLSAGASFPVNIARDQLIHVRSTSLAPAEKRDIADQLLVAWFRAGDHPRVFNTLATISLLLERDGRPDDIVLLDEVLVRHDAGHHDPRVRRRRTRLVDEAERRLGPARSTEIRAAARALDLADAVTQARAMLEGLPDD